MVMARKAKVRGLDEAINELFKNYEDALIEAMRYASKIAKDDIDFKAKSCLYEYYDNYEPTVYDRTDSLINSFVPYMKLERVGKDNVVMGVRASVGMGYDASRLDGVYNGSQKWTPVDGSWVLENYLQGIHPTTDGSFLPGAEYIPIYDSVSPDTKMEEYLNNYTKTFNNNVLISFAKQLTRR
jgi:hypothetical protein